MTPQRVFLKILLKMDEECMHGDCTRHRGQHDIRHTAGSRRKR